MSFKSILTVLTVFLLAATAAEAQITSNSSGPWNVGTTWVGGVVPTATDNVVITSNHIVSINQAQSCANLTLQGTAQLNFAANFTLSASGNLTMTGNTALTGTNNSQVLLVGGTFSVPSGQTASAGGLSLTITGTTSIGGYFQFTSSGVGLKTFNNTITVSAGGTWDNIIGENITVNCDIVNNGFWPASTSGSGVHQVTTAGASYNYSGPKLINMTELRLTTGTGTTISNFGFLALTRVGGNVLNVGSGRKFLNGDGSRDVVLYISGSGTIVNSSGTVDFSKAQSVVEYNYAGAQTIFGTTYNKLVTSNSGTKTVSSATVVTNSVTTANTSVLDVTTSSLTGTANLIMTETSGISFAKTSGTLPELTGTANSFASGTTVTFNGANAQTAKGSSPTNPSTTNTYPYQNISLTGTNASSSVNMSSVSQIAGNLTITNTSKMTTNPVMTIGGTFSFNSSATQAISNDITVGSFVFANGTMNYSNRTITVNGNNGKWINNGGGTFINSSSDVIFTTGTNQQIGGTASTSFANLTINNSNNVTISGVDISVTSGLTLTAGRLITGANSVYVPTGGTVSRTSGYVDGNLQKDISSGSPTPTFEVGSGPVYTPVALSFTGITNAGTITVFSTAGDHPGIGSSSIDPSKSANRYWTLKNSGAVFTSFSATFTFDPTDLDGSAAPASFITKWTANDVTWSSTTAGTRTATSTQIVSEPASTLPITNADIDFQVGNLLVMSGILNRVTGTNNWNNKATWIETRTGTATFSAGSTAVVGSGTLFTTELVVGDVLMLQTSPGVVQGVTVASITDDTHLTLSANATGGAGGYGRQRIPNLPTDVVTIGNSAIIPDAITTIQYDMPAATTINSLDINTAASPRATAQSLTHTSSSTLTIQTNVVVNQPSAAGTDAWNINAGTATVLGTVSMGSGVSNNAEIGRVNITTGTLNVGSLVFNTGSAAGNQASAVMNLSSTGTINMSGSLNFTNGLGTLTPGTTSTFNFNGTSAQFLVFPSNEPTGWNFNNLLFNNSSTAGVQVSPSGQDITAANTTGDVRIQTGTLVTSDDTDITGNSGKTFQIDPGATFRMTGSASSFPTVFSTSLGTTAPFGTVKYEQTAPNPVHIPADAFGNLQVLYSGNAYELPPTGGSVAGTLTVGDGTSTPTLRGDGGSNTTDFNVTHDVVINTGATIDANTVGRITDFSVGGNWINNGTFVPSTNAADVGLTFDATGGVQPQLISGTATETFFKLVIDVTSANTVQMNKNVTVSNTLTLTSGGLDLNGNQVNVTNASLTGITRTTGYIKSEKTSAPYGEVKWSTGALTGAFVFPFAKSATQYIPFTYNVTSAGSSPSSLTVSTYATATNNTPLPQTVTNLNGTSGGNSVVDRFWILTPSNNIVRPTATLIFTAVGGNGATPPSERPGTISDLTTVTTSPAGITGQSWSAANYWNAPSAGQTFANNAPASGFFQVTIPGQLMPNNAAPWALTDAAFPLPVKLVSFTGVSRDGLVELNWKTETEVKNDYFMVQRSMTGEGFEDVVKVQGAGTSTTPKTYSATDNAPAGIWYYRLKQSDFDGTFTYSKIISVEVKEGFRGVSPNPFNGSEFNINFGKEDLGKDVLIKLQDISGKEISQYIVKGLNVKQYKVELPQTLSSGMYIISISVGQEVMKQKLIVK